MQSGDFRRRGMQVATLAGALVLVSCGGGTDLAGVGSGGTGSVATVVGPISGFGSVFVNGIEFDDTNSKVSDNDGISRTRDALRLGMLVSVQGTVATASGTASSIAILGELRGPVDSVNAAAGTFQILGRTVAVNATTVLDGVSGIGGLAGGTFVEVYGLPDASSGQLLATRVEVAQRGLADRKDFKLRGSVANLNAVARTFLLGSQTVSYASAVLEPGNLALSNGQAVKVEAAQRLSSGVLQALKVEAEQDAGFSANAVANVDGIVSGFVSPSSFKVDGVAVDAATAKVAGGVLSQLSNGWRVRVQGTWTGSAIRATTLSLVGGAPDTRLRGEDDDGVEIKGLVTAYKSPSSFTVRGQTVDASKAVFENGSSLALRVGANVEIKGTVSGVGVTASRVKFD